MEDIIIDVPKEKEIEVRFIKRRGDLARTREKAGWERRHEEMDGLLGQCHVEVQGFLRHGCEFLSRTLEAGPS